MWGRSPGQVENLIVSAVLAPVLVRIRLLLTQIQRSKTGREKVANCESSV